jgi:uroporphyrinogen III methyltransferase/synthase
MRPAHLTGRTASSGPGRVTLVGAGPGDPGLLTVAGREALSTAEVVVVDRLVSPEVVSLAPADAEIIYAGKSPGSHHLDQDGICAVLVERALDGANVVRLKGGDPFVFGRGSEEIEACVAAGVECSVLPGVTSAFGVPALAGIPVTARGSSQAVTVVSGHLPPGSANSTVDWRALAAGGGTIVVLMGVGQLGKIAAALIEHGRPGSTPVAIIERGATPAQRTTISTLDRVDQEARAAGVRSPAIIVVGEVAAPLPVTSGPAAPALPLRGRRVFVPRSRSRASALATALRQAGAQVLEETVVLPAADVDALPGTGWLALRTEDDAVALREGLLAAGRDARSLAGIQIAADSDVAAIAGLVPDAGKPPADQPAATVQLSWHSVPLSDAAVHALTSGDIDALAVPSSGTAAALAQIVEALPLATRVAVMGERSAAAAAAAGLRVDGVAREPGIDGLVQTVIDFFR